MIIIIFAALPVVINIVIAVTLVMIAEANNVNNYHKNKLKSNVHIFVPEANWDFHVYEYKTKSVKNNGIPEERDNHWKV